MKGWTWRSSVMACAEIGWGTLRLLREGTTREWPLERGPNGRLTDGCLNRVRDEVRAALGPARWPLRQRMVCGIDGRGVTLRRLSVPRSTREELDRLVSLQIEAEFPLPPDRMAWGYVRLEDLGCPVSNTTTKAQEVLVAAVRQEILAEYTELLGGGNVDIDFTPSALARHRLGTRSGAPGSMLDLGIDQTEVLVANGHGPLRLRVLPWGERDFIAGISERLGMTANEASVFLGNEAADPLADSRRGVEVRDAMDSAMEGLVRILGGGDLGERLVITGSAAAGPAFLSLLSRRLPGVRECTLLPGGAHRVARATLIALEQAASDSGAALLKLRARSAEVQHASPSQGSLRWGALLAVLLLGWMGMPYLEAYVMRPRLAARLEVLRKDQDKLGLIDREYGFLRHLKQNQAPYLDALHVIAKSMPPGARLDSLALNRRGEVTLKGMLGMPQQVSEFRSKLLDSGFFAGVVIEEQTPTPDRQRVTVRIAAQWKPAGLRSNLPVVSTNTSPPAASAPGSVRTPPGGSR